MNARPKVTITPGHFTTKVAVLTEITRDDLWPVTVHQGGFPAAPRHYHDAPVRIYVLAGALFVAGEPSQPVIAAGPGTRIDIPAGAVHTVSAEAEVVTITAFATSAAAAGLPQLPIGPST